MSGASRAIVGLRDQSASRWPTTNLPAGAVAAAAAAAPRATTHLLVAIAAIDGLVAAWLEGHTRLVPAVGAGGSEHLPLATITAIAAATHRGLARGAALRASGRRMHQPTAGVEFLLAGCEHEVTPALATPECLIGGQDRKPFFWSCAPSRIDRGNSATARNRPTRGENAAGENPREFTRPPASTMVPF